jgi:hypothetical protein
MSNHDTIAAPNPIASPIAGVSASNLFRPYSKQGNNKHKKTRGDIKKLQ